VGPIGEGRQQVQVLTYHVGRACKRAITPRRLRIFAATCEPDHVPPPLCSVCYITLHAGTRGTLSTSKTPGDHVAVFNLAADGGTNNAGLNVVSANTAFSACEVSGHETGHGTLKISHVNPGPNPTSDANAAALSIDLQAGKEGGTAAQGIFLKSTTGGTSGEIVHYVDSNGVTIFALLPDGSLLLRPLAAPPTGTKAGLKLCNVGGTLGVVNSAGIFTPLT